MNLSDDYFNSVYDRIIDTYNKGYCSNGDEFLRYIQSEEDVKNLLLSVKDITTGIRNIRTPVLYNQKYFAELFYNSIIDAYDNGLISNAEDFLEYISNREDISNFYVMTLAIIADTIEDVYYDMSSVYNSNKIEYALGSDLDSIGEIIGCPRPSSTKSCVNVNFRLNSPTSKTIIIPKGVIVGNGGSVNFVTQEDGVIEIGKNNVDVYCLSMGTGTDTRVLTGTISKIESGFDAQSVGGLHVTNLESSSGGRNEYTDDEYRVLLMNWVRNNIRGSREAYERYFSSFDGLDSYKLIPNWNGSGTLKVVLDPGYPYQLQQAYDEIMESVAQFHDDVTMWSPTKVNISVYALCNVDIDEVNPYSTSEKEEIKSRIVDAIKIYVNGDTLNSSGLGIGEDFVPYQLGLFIGEFVPEVKNISFVKSNKVNSSIVDDDGNVCVWLSEPVSINDEEIAFIKSEDIVVEIE